MNESENAADLQRAAWELARLASGPDGFSVVLAESCTGGLIAASLTGVPGASKWFCGSSVVYQATTKIAWLGASMDLIARYSAESTEMTQALARAALEQTPEANVSCATTGHLEPDEGRVRDQPHVFVAISRRIDDAILEPATFERQLYEDTRIARQQECTMFAIRKLFEVGQALSQRKNQT